VADLAATARVLRVERGRDDARLLQGLKTPYGVTVLSGLRQPTGPGDGPSAGKTDDGSGALLMMLEAEDLPQPLPSNWKIVRRSAKAVTALVFMQSRIDWSRFEVCVQPADGSPRQCGESERKTGADKVALMMFDILTVLFLFLGSVLLLLLIRERRRDVLHGPYVSEPKSSVDGAHPAGS
jgi:hypothetical protein